MNDKTQELVGQESRQLTTPVVDTTPAGLLAHAMQSGASLDQLEKFMELQERWEAKEAKKSYVTAMSDFRAKCPSIERTENVTYETDKGVTSYNHASLAGTIEQIKKVLAKCGLSHSWTTVQENGGVSVTCHITHSDGHSESTSLHASPDTSGGKNGIQALGSAVSYLERYTLFAILGLAAKGQDDDGGSIEGQEIERITLDQEANLQALIEEIGVNKDRFLKFLKSDSLSNIQASAYDECVRQLERNRK